MIRPMNHHKAVKSQSAMEYLMTYGWAILIIAVVLGALFALGVFNSTSLAGSSCLATPGYECQNPTLTTSGELTFTFGQSTPNPLYNVQLECAATVTSSGEPNPTGSFNSISSTGAVLPYSTTGNSMPSTSVLTISQLPCYSSTGNVLSGSGVDIGAGFSGYIWVNYTIQPGAEAQPSNPWITSKIITIKTKVV
jgi:hypothetical protein